MQNNSVVFALIITTAVTIGGIALGSVLQRTVNEPNTPGIAKQSESSSSVEAPDRLNGVNDTSTSAPADRQADRTDDADTDEQLQSSDRQSGTAPSQSSARQAVSEGFYEPYSEKNVADISAKTKIIYFNSVDCEICRAFEDDILSSGVPHDVAIFHADIEELKTLAEKYEVKDTGTVVRVDEQGDKIKSHTLNKGTATVKKILDILK